jgi:carbonic anhydrase
MAQAEHAYEAFAHPDMHEQDPGCRCHRTAKTGIARRRLMLTGIAGATLGAGLGCIAPRPAFAQSKLTPDEALQALMEGNQRFVEKKMTSFSEDLAILKQNTVAKQEPFAAVLSCADSRVPVEIVFDQSIGHLFVTRVAGNIATPDNIASLEYGAAVLGTKAILVLGHASCGAMKATIDGKEVPGQISELYAALRPAADAAGTDLDAAIRENAKIQAHLLATASPVLAGLIKQKQLKIVAGYYNLTDGKVSLLG